MGATILWLPAETERAGPLRRDACDSLPALDILAATGNTSIGQTSSTTLTRWDGYASLGEEIWSQTAGSVDDYCRVPAGRELEGPVPTI